MTLQKSLQALQKKPVSSGNSFVFVVVVLLFLSYSEVFPN